MNRRNEILTFVIAAATGFLIALALWPSGPAVTGKTDRLAGTQVETAFLPERFGVPSRE
jgi:hypothetical protein